MITRLFKEIRKFFAPPEKFTKTELQHFCAGPTNYAFRMNRIFKISRIAVECLKMVYIRSYKRDSARRINA